MTMPDLAEGSRPLARRFAAPVAMLFFCLCGMAIGLAIDCGATPPDILASLCLSASNSFTAALAVHWRLFPATHVMMLAGALVAIGLTASSDGPSAVSRKASLVGDALCVGAMFAGMTVGAWLGPILAARLGVAADFATLTGSMAAGMAVGMLVALPLQGAARSTKRPPGRDG